MKEQLRRTLLSLRKNLSETEVYEYSKRIVQRLWSLLVFSQATTIMHYISYDNEVFTHDLIQECLEMGKTVVVPVTHIQSHTITPSLLRRWEDLQKGPYGLLEPIKDMQEEVSLVMIDVFLVPGVGFDVHGNRLGHGKGYYDRLLKNRNARPIIGLAFECQIVEHIPTGHHDKPVDIIITEQRIIQCSNNF